MALFGAEREEGEDWFAPVAEGVWRQEELSLCVLTALSPGQRFTCAREFRISAVGSASFFAEGVGFSWWVILSIRFVDAEPLQVAIPLQVSSRLVSSGPFR